MTVFEKTRRKIVFFFNSGSFSKELSRFFEIARLYSFKQDGRRELFFTEQDYLRFIIEAFVDKNDFLKQGKWFSKEKAFKLLRINKLYRRAFLGEFSQETFWECFDTKGSRTTCEQLSLKNCKEKGYEWIKDIIFDPEAPEIANKDIFSLIQKGYKLGIPASKSAGDVFVGLYKPVKQKS